jgi:hypothetical protein
MGIRVHRLREYDLDRVRRNNEGDCLRVLVYDTGRIDLEAPIWMSVEQREEFIQFFRERLQDVKLKDVEEPDREFRRRVTESKPWSVDEYLTLLTSATNEKIAGELGRSDMSVIMKRGEFPAAFYAWLKRKRYSTPATREMVQEYLEEE